MNVAKDINLNFVSRMAIDQTYERLPDGTRLITKDDMSLNFKLTEKSKGMYARRLVVYSNHSFDKPPNPRKPASSTRARPSSPSSMPTTAPRSTGPPSARPRP